MHMVSAEPESRGFQGGKWSPAAEGQRDRTPRRGRVCWGSQRLLFWAHLWGWPGSLDVSQWVFVHQPVCGASREHR